MQLMHHNRVRRYLHAACVTAALYIGLWIPPAQATGVLGASPETNAPLVTQSSTPLVLLTMARDHTLFYGAYIDLTSFSGTGTDIVGFQKTTQYVGLFNSNYCYQYTGGALTTYTITDPSNNNSTSTVNALPPGTDGLFSPAAIAVTSGISPNTVYGQCVSSGQSAYWSGNFLNFLTTARIDAIRVALYGGTREVDNSNDTILVRAYVPPDGHVWGVDYVSTQNNGYDIALFTPLAQPTYGRHLLGNMTNPIRDGTTNHNCNNLQYCSSFPPLLRVLKNTMSEISDWLTPNNTVLKVNGNSDYKDYAVRVNVCTPNYIEGCQPYPSVNSPSYYKPIGVLHTYGESGKAKIGLITGSYDVNLSGGRIRKNISSFANEINPDNGQFLYPTPSIIKQIDNFKIIGYNDYSGTFGGGYYNNKYGNAGESDFSNNSYADWNNPMAEMMYEGLRYFKGAARTDAFNPANPYFDNKVGLASPAWTDPYADDGGNVCAKPSLFVISSDNTQYDYDQLPGSYWNPGFGGSLTNALGTSLNVATLANTIGSAANENINGTTQIVGEAPNSSGDGDQDRNNKAPTEKVINTLGSIRGQPVNQTGSGGSYYAASVAYFGKQSGLRSIGGISIPTVDTTVLALNTPFPKISIPFPGGKAVTVNPFGQITAWQPPAYSWIYADKSTKALNAEIIGASVLELTDPLNANGAYRLRVKIRYAGALIRNEGFSLLSTVLYDIQALNNTVQVSTKVIWAAGGAGLAAGFIVTGTTADGPYLVTQSYQTNRSYFLHVPADFSSGACDVFSIPADCSTLPYYQNTIYAPNYSYGASIFTFTPAAAQVTSLLKSPLWYAARWGGYRDGYPPSGSTTSDPERYLLLQNSTKIKTSLAALFQSVDDNSRLPSARASSGQQVNTRSQIFTTRYDITRFSGELKSTTARQSVAGEVGAVQYAVDWTASLPTAGARNIYYQSTNGSLSQFTFANVNTDYPNNLSSDLVGYLRGDQSMEILQGGVFRNRASLLGTTINSAPVYSQDTGMVYVGANDGMLHAFDASTGVENSAFVPSALISTTATVDGVASRSILAKLSSPNYTARYFMDGSIAVSNLAVADANMGGVNYLVGFLGRGGKGLFGLPVNRQGFPSGVRAWENYGVNDSDMGYLLGSPVIERLSDGTNVVLFGNGYNSTNNQATLYVLRLSDGVVLGKYATSAGTSNSPNGLATPVVTRRNGYLQYAYAGDYLGNVWKFDLTTLGNAAQPTETFSGANAGASKIIKLFTAVGPNNSVQPIVAPLATAYSGNISDADVSNKRFIFFGTGSDLTNTDLGSSSQQTIYGLIDDGTVAFTPVIGNRNSLRVRTLETTTGTFFNASASQLVVRSFTQPTSGDMQSKSGWYMDLSKPVSGSSEQVYSVAMLRSTTTPSLVVSSNIVNNTVCQALGSGFLNAMDAYRGGGLADSFFDINGNGRTNDEIFSVSNSDKVISSVDFKSGALGQAIFYGNTVVAQGVFNSGEKPNLVDAGVKKSSQISRRVSWREIVK